MLQLIDEDGRAMDDGTELAAKSQLTLDAESGKVRGSQRHLQARGGSHGHGLHQARVAP